MTFRSDLSDIISELNRHELTHAFLKMVALLADKPPLSHDRGWHFFGYALRTAINFLTGERVVCRHCMPAISATDKTEKKVGFSHR